MYVVNCGCGFHVSRLLVILAFWYEFSCLGVGEIVGFGGWFDGGLCVLGLFVWVGFDSTIGFDSLGLVWWAVLLGFLLGVIVGLFMAVFGDVCFCGYL